MYSHLFSTIYHFKVFFVFENMNSCTYFSSGYLVACFVGVLGVLVPLSLAQGDCWTTGCQPSDWAVVGCEQYQRSEQGTEPCEDDRGVSGLKYTCCANQAFGDDANFEGNSRRFRADGN